MVYAVKMRAMPIDGACDESAPFKFYISFETSNLTSDLRAEKFKSILVYAVKMRAMPIKFDCVKFTQKRLKLNVTFHVFFTE